MPESLRALLVVLALASVVFVFARNPACAIASEVENFKLRRNLWFGITLTVFLANNFWIYAIVVTILLLIASRHEPNKIALFFFLLFAAPTSGAEIPGFGVINHFFTINYPRILSLTILLPAYLYLRLQPNTESFGRLFPDKLVAGYLVLMFMLILVASTFTHALRAGLFYAFLDVFLPYYVASRCLRNLQSFRDALMGFVVAALILSAIGVFEFWKHWLLYSSLNTSLGVASGYGIYLERGDGVLRAQASTGHAIPLGFVIATAIGFFLFLRKSVPNTLIWSLGMMLLVAGLLAPLSRGPWVGAAAILLIFVLTSPSPGWRLLQLGGLAVIGAPFFLSTSAGARFLELLPFIGTASGDTITYRQQLLELTISVISRNPFFGAFDYMLSPEMQQMRQGGGIIDIVNSYLAIALASGLVGLSLFVSFFITIVIGIYLAMKNLADNTGEVHVLGQALLSTLIGILIIIFTVSSITIIPVVYWATAGLGVAYVRMLALAKESVKTVALERQPDFHPAAMGIGSRTA